MELAELSFGFTCNASLRYQEINGRQFAIAPITFLKPQVLVGSKGALYYPEREIEQSLPAWNGKPLTVRHPVRNGSNVSANAPDIFANQEIGRLYNVKQLKDGSAVGDGYFDLELTKRLASNVWDALQNKRKIEISTGLYTDNEEAPVNSQYEGTPYAYIARNYKPDHLAILPDEIGACSVQQGCGVFNNDLVDNPSWVGDHSLWEKAKAQAYKEGKGSDYAYITGIYKQMGGDIKGNVDTNNIDWTQKQRDKLPESDFAGPNQSFPIKTQEDVDSAAKLIGHADNPEEVKRNIIRIAKRKGLSIPDAWKQEQQNNQSSVTNSILSQEDILSSARREYSMNERENIINWLTTNCTCLKDKKATLNALPDNQLKEVLLENAEKTAEVDNDQTFLDWIGNADKEIKNAFTTYMRNKLKGAIKLNEFPPKKKPDAAATDTTGTDTDAAAAMMTEEEKKKKMMQDMMNQQQQNQTANNTAQAPVMTQEQLFAIMPGLKAIITNAEQAQNREKEQLILQLTANISDGNQRLNKAKELANKSLDDLRLFASLNGPAQQQQVANYFGATGGSPTDIVDNNALQQEQLVINEIDWKEWAKNTGVYDSANA